jgi:hypothetical protein
VHKSKIRRVLKEIMESKVMHGQSTGSVYRQQLVGAGDRLVWLSRGETESEIIPAQYQA